MRSSTEVQTYTGLAPSHGKKGKLEGFIIVTLERKPKYLSVATE